MSSIFEAIKAGKSLTNASTWANVQGATVALKSIIAFSLGAFAFFSGVDLHVSDQVISTLSVGIASVVWGVTECVHLYLGYATNPQAGLPPNSGSDNSSSKPNENYL